MEGPRKRQLRVGQPPGERHAQAKLTEAQVREIHARVGRGEPCKALAEEFGVTVHTVYAIAKGRTWVHLGLPPVPVRRGAARPGARLTEQDIPVICTRIQEGESISEVARNYRVGITCIANIWHGRTWQHVPRPVFRRRVWEG